MNEKVKNRITIFIMSLVILAGISIGFSVRLGNEYIKYQEYSESLGNDGGLYIDGADFSGLVNIGKQVKYSAAQAVGDLAALAVIFIFSLAAFVTFGFVALKGKRKDTCKTECLVYTFATIGTMIAAIIIGILCARLSSIGMVVTYNMTYAVTALLFVGLRAWILYSKADKAVPEKAVSESEEKEE